MSPQDNLVLREERRPRKYSGEMFKAGEQGAEAALFWG